MVNMLHQHSFRFLCLCAFLVQNKIWAYRIGNSTQNKVVIKPSADKKLFEVPTSDEPLLSWMDVQMGVYPNTTRITNNLTVGNPITIFIYFIDKSYMYDLMVTECWAYDDDTITSSKNKLLITSLSSVNPKRKMMGKWEKKQFPKDNPLKSLLYVNMKAFKFPDKDQLYIKCDIQLCFKSCDKQSKNKLL